jgi:hypothetical protein
MNGSILEMPFGKRAAGAGLQVPFEPERRLFSRELDADVQRPRTISGGVRAATGIVIGETLADGGGDAHVEMWRLLGALENVDEAPWLRHALLRRKANASQRRADYE